MGGARRVVGREEKEEEAVFVAGGVGLEGFGMPLVGCLKELSERRLEISCD